MTNPRTRVDTPPYPAAKIWPLGLLAFLMLVPVTLPVTVLRGLVQERFAVGELGTSLFMSINMIGAAIAAPLAGAFADRIGRRRNWVLIALAADSLLLLGLQLPIPFWAFMGLRFLEGAAHIVALSLLLGIASQARAEPERGRVMGLTGAGLTLGVALGAPIGGYLGSDDPLLPLRAGSAIVALAGLVAWWGLEETPQGEERPSLADVIATLRKHPLLFAPLAFAFADRFTVGFYTTTFSLFLSRIHDFDPPRIGIHIAYFMLPFALLSYPFGKLSERTSRVAMMCSGSVLYGLLTISVGFCPPVALPGLMVGLGVASAVMFVPSMLITTDAAPPAVRTTALGAFNAAGSLGFIAGPAIGGIVSSHVASNGDWLSGYRAAFAVAGVSELACVAIALPFLARLVRGRQTT